MPLSAEQNELLAQMLGKMAVVESLYFTFQAGDIDDPRWETWDQLSKSERSAMLGQQKALREVHRQILNRVDEVIQLFKRFQQLGRWPTDDPESRGSTLQKEVLEAHDTVFYSWREMHLKCAEILSKIEHRYDLVIAQRDKGTKDV